MVWPDAVKPNVEEIEPCSGVHEGGIGLDPIVPIDACKSDLTDAGRIAAGGFDVQRDETKVAIGDQGLQKRA